MYTNIQTVGDLKPTTTATIIQATEIAAPILDSVLPGLGTAISSLTPIITGFFTEKPCDPSKAGPCASSKYWDGRVTLREYRECCNPQLSGLGVLLTEHQPGYKYWPSKFREIPAGDYWSVDTNIVEEKFGPDYPSAGFSENELSGIVIPHNWKVQIFKGQGFEGESLVLPQGVHLLHKLGFGDKVKSIKVRGPWGWYDYLAGKELLKQRPGWITFTMPPNPSKTVITKLVLSDPNRVLPLSFDEPIIPWEPFWGPGWNYKLQYLQEAASVSPKTREQFAQKKAISEIMQTQAAQQII